MIKKTTPMNFLKQNKDSITGHSISIIIFLAIALFHFLPEFQGKTLNQHDKLTYKGAAKEVRDYNSTHDDEALWTNSMFGGMPSYIVSNPKSHNLIAKIDKVLALGTPRPFSFYMVAAISFYILMLVLGLSVQLSRVGAIAFAYGSYNLIILQAGHFTKLSAIAIAPLIIAGVILSFKDKRLLGGILLAVGLSIEIVYNHLQITYYMMLLCLIIVLVEFYFALKTKSLIQFAKTTAIMVAFASLAILTNIDRLSTTYEYSKHSTRGKSELISEGTKTSSGLDLDYATQWSYGKMETFTLLVPKIYGGSSAESIDKDSDLYKELKKYNVPKSTFENFPIYWGAQPMTSGPVYMGAIVLFLFVLGLYVVKGKIKWWLVIATIFAILLCWGRNFMWFTEIMFDILPGYNKFRTVSMTLVICQITMPILAILALKEILISQAENRKTYLKQIQYSTYITAGLALLFAIFPLIAGDHTALSDGNLPKDLQSILVDYRIGLTRSSALQSSLLIVLTAFATTMFLKGKLRKSRTIIAIGVLITIDMLSISTDYLNSKHYVDASKKNDSSNFIKSNADKIILEDSDINYRVLNIAKSTFQDASTSYYHKSIGGYCAAKMGRYQELIDHNISGEINTLLGSLQTAKTANDLDSCLEDLSILNALNTKYIIYNGEAAPITNRSLYGDAWFVDKIKFVNNANEELLSLKTTDLKRCAIVDNRYKEIITETDFVTKDASIVLKEHSINHIKYEYRSTTDQFVVLSEVYYDDGWKAYIDGEEIDYVRTDYILRGVPLEAGNHILEMKFRPSSYFNSTWIAYISSIIILLIIGYCIFTTRKK